MNQSVWLLAVLLALVAAVLDWRSRRIPNWLTIPAMIVGLAVNGFASGWESAKNSLEGIGLMLLLLFPLVLLRGLGAGDWKLMGALGALIGPGQAFSVLLITIFLAGFWALVQMARERRFVQTLRNLWELLRGWFVFGLRPHPELNVGNPGMATLPFGVAAAAATLVCFVGRGRL